MEKHHVAQLTIFIKCCQHDRFLHVLFDPTVVLPDWLAKLVRKVEVDCMQDDLPQALLEGMYALRQMYAEYTTNNKTLVTQTPEDEPCIMDVAGLRKELNRLYHPILPVYDSNFYGIIGDVVLSHMQQEKDVWNSVKHCVQHPQFRQYIKKEGKLFRSNNRTEDARGRYGAKNCWANVAADFSGTIFVGWVIVGGIPLPHAWLVSDQTVIERTPNFEGEYVYFGVPVDKQEYMRAYNTALTQGKSVLDALSEYKI